MRHMNNWKAIAFICFGISLIPLAIGFLEMLAIYDSYSVYNSSLLFSSMLSVFIPFFGISAIFFVIAGVGYYASKPPPRLCPTCFRPIRYINEYYGWYCDYEKKYVKFPENKP